MNDELIVKRGFAPGSEQIAIEHHRDEPLGRGRMVTCIYLSPELAGRLSELLRMAFHSEGINVFRFPDPEQ